MSGHAVIIGGGVIGTSCAYYLTERGWTATIIERGAYAQGASHANCGYISPSHVLPLAFPGAIGKTWKMMRQKNSPFYIKPRIDFRLWKWLWHFARRCNQRDMLASAAAIHTILDSSRKLYDELIADESLACEFQTIGCLFAYRDAEKFEHFAEEDELIRKHFQVGAQKLSADELLAMEPAFRPGVAGAWYYEQDAHLRPDRLMDSWRNVLEQRGVRIHENCSVRGFAKSAARTVAADTSEGEVSGDAFVVATGALTPILERELGCCIPIQPGKGYSITMPRPAKCPKFPMIFPEVKVAVTPFHSGYRLGSTMEFSGYDTTLNRGRLQALREGAALFLQQPYCEPVEEQWYGWRPMTYDSVPLIGKLPAAENLFIAAGHNMLGLSMAPATGKLVAELVTGEKPHIDPSLYRPERFSA
jgi:D-amino-acid dehydrogenase